MKKLSFALIIVLLLGCNDKLQTPEALTETEKESLHETKLEATKVYIQQSERIPGSDYYMYPIGTSLRAKRREYSSKGDYDNRTWNILFL